KLPRYLQLKYTFIPLLILGIFAYYNLDTPVENYIKHYMPNIVGVIFGKITDVGKAEDILIICGVIVFARLFTDSQKL
ncbi:lipid A 1-phosphatase LpxE, partial [Francisella tularensis subsp. holarctica]|nr:lipid A 1-phosphatase LpxE [Francisella tularensis subsp. holarctica]